jgi:hypothetical protein
MFYGQINYNELIGRTNPANGLQPKYRIATTGCFLVGFCNGLKDEFGIEITPLELNAKFRDNGIYVDAAPLDGILDDLGWGSITAVFPNIVVSGSGKGAPPTSNAMVEFDYNSFQTGNPTTHFCWVYSAENHQIIDSYDGQIKDWGVYGGPKAWACYDNHAAVQIDPVQFTPQVTQERYEVIVPVPGFDSSNDAANHLNQKVTVPAASYDVFNEWHGMVNVTLKPGVPGSWINPADNKAPEPAAAAPSADGDVIEVQPGWGISHCLYHRGYPKEQYSSPDKWQWVAQLNGFNSWQEFKLKPLQKIICPPFVAAPAAPAPADPSHTDYVEAITTPAEPAALDFTEKFGYVEEPGRFVATINSNVKDYAGENPDLVLPAGKVNVAGYFFVEEDGERKKKYRSVYHAEHGEWYGIPVTAVVPLKDNKPVPRPNTDKDDDATLLSAVADLNLKDELIELGRNMKQKPEFRQLLLRAVGTLAGYTHRIKFWKK